MIIGIVCYPTFGGSGVLATELGIELSKKGYEIHFITYNQPVKLELYSNKVHFHEVGFLIIRFFIIHHTNLHFLQDL